MHATSLFPAYFRRAAAGARSGLRSDNEDDASIGAVLRLCGPDITSTPQRFSPASWPRACQACAAAVEHSPRYCHRPIASTGFRPCISWSFLSRSNGKRLADLRPCLMFISRRCGGQLRMFPSARQLLDVFKIFYKQELPLFLANCILWILAPDTAYEESFSSSNPSISQSGASSTDRGQASSVNLPRTAGQVHEPIFAYRLPFSPLLHTILLRTGLASMLGSTCGIIIPLTSNLGRCPT